MFDGNIEYYLFLQIWVYLLSLKSFSANMAIHLSRL